jgi:5'-nucleotidase
MEMNAPYILITNDDGIDSPGILALAEALKEIGEVIVVAPDRQQSAISNAVSVNKPLRVAKYYGGASKLFGYAVDGSPSDCVKLALTTLVDRKPDLVVSGINHGQNTAINILYSGTVAGAAEGMLAGIKSIAVSVNSHDPRHDVSAAAHYTKIIAQHTLEADLPKGVILNVNVPSIPIKEIKGIRITHHSSAIWKDYYEKRTDPFGRDYYWFAGEYNVLDNEPDSDDAAISENYVSVSPIQFNFTNFDLLDKMKNGMNFLNLKNDDKILQG